MTFLRILALVYVAMLTITTLESLFGEPAATKILLVILVVVSYQLLRQLWRERS